MHELDKKTKGKAPKNQENRQGENGFIFGLFKEQKQCQGKRQMGIST